MICASHNSAVRKLAGRHGRIIGCLRCVRREMPPQARRRPADAFGRSTHKDTARPDGDVVSTAGASREKTGHAFDLPSTFLYLADGECKAAGGLLVHRGGGRVRIVKSKRRGGARAGMSRVRLLGSSIVAATVALGML